MIESLISVISVSNLVEDLIALEVLMIAYSLSNLYESVSKLERMIESLISVKAY